MAATGAAVRPSHVGILAMEMYTPSRFVAQEDLEAADNCAGKYTVGLGQLKMAFCDDREDITSIFLTAVHALLEKYEISPQEIGRIEVGTETLIDKSKSVKTSLMRLFGENTDLEGVTNVNACYGGTAAIFNSIAWVESSEWDGRYALVVCGDIAVYEAGPARPTGGCGALAILIGPDAILAMEPGVRASHTLDVYDFYKPYHSEYAAVDGKLSQWAYLSSVDQTYTRFKQKFAARNPGSPAISADSFDFFAFHTPYNKLVQKGFSRIVYMDARDGSLDTTPEISPFISTPLAETYESRDIEAATRSIAQSKFTEKVMPTCKLNQNIGNCYTGSVWASLLSLICEKGEDIVGKRVGLFSYGSGSVASFFSLVGRTSSNSSKFSLDKTRKASDMFARLDKRKRCTVEEFCAALDKRAAKYGAAPSTPEGPLEAIEAGTYYLADVNAAHHRSYARA